MLRRTTSKNSRISSKSNAPAGSEKKQNSGPPAIYFPEELKIFAFSDALRYEATQVWRSNCIENSDIRFSKLKELTATKERRRVVFRELNKNIEEGSFSFDLNNPSDKQAATTAIHFDFLLSKFKPIYVPKYVSEKDFFRNYFSHVAHIRREFGKPSTSSRKHIVIVGSLNPVKINATRMCFDACFPKHAFEFYTYNASSEVSVQPMSDEETKRGARNRSLDCYKHRRAITEERYDITIRYCVGIEGGCREIDYSGKYECFAWVAIYDAHSDRISYSRTASFILPDVLNKLLQKGFELGKADEMVYGSKNNKQNIGTVGILTNGIIDRTEFYRHAAVLALSPFAFKSKYNLSIDEPNVNSDSP